MDIKKNILQLRAELPPHVKLVAVSKTQPVDRILQAMDADQWSFGENRVQELLPKYQAIPQAEWHLVGHLQTNKVKYVVPFIHLIQSVDSMRLLLEINKHAQRINRVVQVLLQIHIAREETKFGLSYAEAEKLLLDPLLVSLTHVQIRGLMGIATFTDDLYVVREEFRGLRRFFEALQKSSLPPAVHMHILSMGMSNDYRLAIDEGSNLIRVGTAIFGQRV
jgi:pyridoxal phosphate enzyme (YggS family)